MIDLDDFEIAARHAVAIRKMLHDSTLQAVEQPEVENKTLLDENVRPLPRWASGFYSDFDALLGGFCGLTVLAGPGGSGKSTHAIACALENAMSPGTCVAYFDAENALGDQIVRARNWWGSDADFRSNMEAMALRFHWFEVLPGHSWEQLMRNLAQRVLLDHERVLLIFDSMFSIARCFGGNTLDVCSRMYLALVSMIRRSEGRIRVLALSEMNKDGGVKGLEGVYASTLALMLTPDPEKGDDVVHLKMLKNRSGPLRRDLGFYQIDSGSNRLRRSDDARESYRGNPDPYGLEH